MTRERKQARSAHVESGVAVEEKNIGTKRGVAGLEGVAA
jgi:hypothetical protein